ncbi:MAG: GNAT family protein [Vicinamibacterales bacterium]|nr:GNAT family protein [Vicinamibacterales bacterium]
MSATPEIVVGTTALEAGGVDLDIVSQLTHWRDGLPELVGAGVTLREIRPADGPTLFSMMSAPEVTQFIWPPPSTLEGFDKFITWSERQRAAGNCLCFGVVPDGCEAAVGLFQLRTLDPGAFDTAEWGFAMGSAFWGTGLFQEAAVQVIDFAFDVVGVHRLEARAASPNGRGNGALHKLGAVQEGVLRRSFLKDGQFMDQILWAILDIDWRLAHEQAVALLH